MGGVQNTGGYWPCYGDDLLELDGRQVDKEQTKKKEQVSSNGTSMQQAGYANHGLHPIPEGIEQQKKTHCRLCEFEVKFIQTDYKKFHNSWQKMNPSVLEFKQYLTIQQYSDHYVRDNVMMETDEWLAKLEEACYKQFGLGVEPFTRIQNIITYTEPPLAILHDDLVGNMVNSHYQLLISQSRYKLVNEHLDFNNSLRRLTIPDQLDYLVTQQSKQKSLTLQCVIYILKNCHCKYFQPNLNYEYIFFNQRESQEMSLFSFILSLYKQMAHMAYNFRSIFLSFISQHRDHNYYSIIAVYNYLYTCYMEVAFSINQKYSELGDIIQHMYSEIVYNDAELPHFRLITAFVKFWAVIFLQGEVWVHLLKSWRAAQRQKPIQYDALHELVASIIDVSYNQISIHWLGDCRIKNAPNKLMLDFIVVYIQETETYYNTLLDRPPEDCYKALDEDLLIQKRIFPTWFVDCHVEPIVLHCKSKKIQNLMYIEVDALIQSNSEFQGRSKIIKKPKEEQSDYILFSAEIDQAQKQKEEIQIRVEGNLDSGFIGTSTGDMEKFKLPQINLSQTQDDLTAVFLMTSQNLNKSSEIKKYNNNETYTTFLTAASIGGQGISLIGKSELIPHYIKPNEEGLELARQIPYELKAQLQQLRSQEEINIAKRYERLESQTMRAKQYKIQENRQADQLNYLKADNLYQDIKQSKAQNTLKASLNEFLLMNIKNLTQRSDEIKVNIVKQALDISQQQQLMNDQLFQIEQELRDLTEQVQNLQNLK